MTLIVFTACMSPSTAPPPFRMHFYRGILTVHVYLLCGCTVKLWGVCSSTYLEDATYFSTRFSSFFSSNSIIHASISHHVCNSYVYRHRDLPTTRSSCALDLHSRLYEKAADPWCALEHRHQYLALTRFFKQNLLLCRLGRKHLHSSLASPGGWAVNRRRKTSLPRPLIRARVSSMTIHPTRARHRTVRRVPLTPP